MTAELDTAALFQPTTAPTGAGAPRKCRRHVWHEVRVEFPTHPGEDGYPAPDASGSFTVCTRCGAMRDPERAKRGRSSRRLGHDGERRSERRYGWRKVGEYGGITDLEGTMAVVQQKTTRRDAPALWRGVFSQLGARAGGRIPLLLLSFVRQGVAADDYIVIRGSDWLALHGLDQPEGEAR